MPDKPHRFGDPAQYAASISADEPVKIYIVDRWYDGTLPRTYDNPPRKGQVWASAPLAGARWVEADDVLRLVDYERWVTSGTKPSKR